MHLVGLGKTNNLVQATTLVCPHDHRNRTLDGAGLKHCGRSNTMISMSIAIMAHIEQNMPLLKHKCCRKRPSEGGYQPRGTIVSRRNVLVEGKLLLHQSSIRRGVRTSVEFCEAGYAVISPPFTGRCHFSVSVQCVSTNTSSHINRVVYMSMCIRVKTRRVRHIDNSVYSTTNRVVVLF